MADNESLEEKRIRNLIERAELATKNFTASGEILLTSTEVAEIDLIKKLVALSKIDCKAIVWKLYKDGSLIISFQI
jgi:hypothetical protein